MTSDDNSLMTALIGLSAAVMLSKYHENEKSQYEGLSLTLIDTMYRDERNMVDFTAYVQLKAAYLFDGLSFELAMLKVGSADEDDNYFGVTLKEYSRDEIRKTIPLRHIEADSESLILTADRFKETFKFVHHFPRLSVPEIGRYALAVLANIDAGTQVLLDAYYFDVEEKLDYSKCDLRSCDFTNKKLSRADFSYTDLSKTNFTNAELIAANLSKVKLFTANLSGVNLTGANLTGAIAMNTNFQNANLGGTNLTNAKMSGCNFCNADFSGANLTGANLSGSTLNSANFTGANLTRAIFTGTNKENAIFDKVTRSE